MLPSTTHMIHHTQKTLKNNTLELLNKYIKKVHTKMYGL